MAFYRSLRIFNFRRSASNFKAAVNHMRLYCSMDCGNEVILETVEGKGIITLNRPKALNTLNLSMIRTIMPQIRIWEEDPHISMIMIKGTGGKAFCAGGDVRAITESGKEGTSYHKDFFKEEYILNNAIGTLQIPYIALIDGITMGGGVGLSVHGTFRIATERTLFAMPETAIGLFPDVGGSYFLSRLGGRLGIYLALTGYRLKGIQVQKAGVATHYVESSKLENLQADLLALNKPSQLDISHVIETYQQQSLTGLDDPDFELHPYKEKMNECFGQKTLEQIFKALENEGSIWALKQLETLKKMSPTSMKVALREIQEGADLDMQDCFEMEYRLSQRFCEDKDFYEGVRAVLVDKDNAPKWEPSNVEEVTDEHVDWYFSQLPEHRELRL
ncbi:3-hydroxyisobutyryl-CoA hydrolase, mitochondrial-like isoform X2 [Tubulanus polymorphus]|uniref:3-hydroxyisobutyryl-CoA hydrolase, mitochondrial-like isoform X2 n=1 Tax=Tubulanus polymorphus TaxID=672921 RepID=UPI003DA620A4